MPRPGDQYRDTPASANPFADSKPTITGYSAQEIATLQHRLDKQLGPEYISTRPGAGGGKVHYLAAEKVINLANEVFGFNGWSSSIQNVQIDFVDEHPQNGKITLGLSTIVRVTIRDGTFHEDIGYGHIENCKGKAAAFEKAKKEAATDALKRALRNFGNVLGNCLYDKNYLQRVTKVKIAPSKWDADNLHRHRDYAPIKKESIADAEERALAAKRQVSAQSGASFASADFEEDFGDSMLNEDDFTHPDEVQLDDTVLAAIEQSAPGAFHGPPQQQGGAQQKQTAAPRMHSMPQLRPPNAQPPPLPQTPQAVQRPPPHNAGQVPPNRMPPPQQQQQQQHGLPPRAQQPTTGPPQRPLQTSHASLQQQQQQQQQQQHHYHQPQHHPQHPQHPQQYTQQLPQSDGSNSRSNSSSATSLADSPSNNAPQASRVQTVDGQLLDESGLPMPRFPPPGNPEGFVTSRSVDLLNQPPETRPPNVAFAFNPHADSPSIRRTAGINPGKSAPVSRQSLGGNAHPSPPPQPPPTGPAHGAGGVGPGVNGTSTTTPVRTSNFVNPAADLNRRIGAPGTGGGVPNRGPYRPPTAVGGVKRPALADVSNSANHAGIPRMDGAGDGKKPKLETEAAAGGPKGLPANHGGENANATTMAVGS